MVQNNEKLKLKMADHHYLYISTTQNLQPLIDSVLIDWQELQYAQ